MKDSEIKMVINLMTQAYKAGARDVNEGTIIAVDDINDHVSILFKKIINEEISKASEAKPG